MPRKDEIDRMIVLLYLSRNSSGYTNFCRSIDWLDKLPMKGLEELIRMFEIMREDVKREIEQRVTDGMPRYSREWHNQLAAEEKGGAELLRSIGVGTIPKA